DGSVKIIDFGIAKAQSNIESTTTGVLKGKYTYMSPEQALQDDVDGRSDVFSLGIVLHEMLTQKKLFRRKGKDPLTVLKEIVEKPMPLPSIVADHPISEALDRIVDRALQKDRDARFATAREMQEALVAYLRDEPTTETDLEQFMEEVSGSIAENQQKLRDAIEQEHFSIPPLETSGTSSKSLPTWSRVDKVPETTELTEDLHARYRVGLWLSLGMLVIATGALLAVLLWSPRFTSRSVVVSPPLPPVAANALSPASPRIDQGPRAVSPVGPVQLLVKSIPLGAHVWVDGKAYTQTTPTVLTLKPGTKQVALVLRRAGYKDEAFVMHLEEGVQEVLRKLRHISRATRKPGKRHPTQLIRGHG
ncbi:MAG: protein kinase, partial [Deltaproteobacteria bacterium]|nr:protein kinase [Deltaproteobacteria bacterium]